jgi:uroporphyrinogen decarboxylase
MPEHAGRPLGAACQAVGVPTPATDAVKASLTSPFMRAVRGEPVSRTPVWFMRQAGRSLPEYHELRKGTAMLDSCMDADLVTEITLQPVRRYGVDAAILYSDIVLPLKAVGVDLDIKPGVGPVVATPVRTLADVDAIPDLVPEHVPYITQAVGQLVAELGTTPLIGFAGAPFTVASYLVEGGPSREHALTKAMMFGAPDVWDALMRKIAGIAAAYLEVQVAAGASAVQLFDSWAGALTPADYAAYAQPYSAEVLGRAGALGVPRIHFGVGTANLLGLMGEAGADVVGVDWRTPLGTAIGQVGDRGVQGNLDPTLVFAPTEVMTARAAEIIEAGRAARGHVFNLGHGVLPSTDPDQLKRLTEFVQSYPL